MIAQISVMIFIFTLFFIIFAYSKTDKNIGIWIVIIILSTFLLGMTTAGTDQPEQRIHPSFLIGQYSKYNTPPSIHV